MKTTIKLFAVLLTVISTAAFAAGSENVAEVEQATIRILPGSEMNVFRVRYVPTEKQSLRVKKYSVREKKQSVRVSIFDAKGQLVITERIQSENGFVKPYNLARRNPGIYTIQIKDRNTTIDKYVVVRHQPEDNNGHSQVTVKKVDGKNRFSVLVSNPYKRKISVKIFDRWDNMIFEESVSSAQRFSKVYNLKYMGYPSNPPSSWTRGGTFTFEISDDTGVLKSITL